MALSLVTAPAVEPLSLSEAKLHCRVDIPDEDVLFDNWIRSAREYVETFTRRALITQTWDEKCDAFPYDYGVFELPLANVTAISSISYVDPAGATQTWSSSYYQTDLPTGPKCQRARIIPAYGQVYPPTRPQMNAVTVRFVAGYGTTADRVPESIRAGMKVLVGHWYMNRERVSVGIGIAAVQVPDTIEALLWPYRAF